MGTHLIVGPIISGGELRVRHSFGGKPIVVDGEVSWLDMSQLTTDATVVVNKMETLV